MRGSLQSRRAYRAILCWDRRPRSDSDQHHSMLQPNLLTREEHPAPGLRAHPAELSGLLDTGTRRLREQRGQDPDA